MESSQIKNVVFDVGNVLVRWSPPEIVRLTFGHSVDAEQMAKRLFSNKIWLDLNKGLISEEEAIHRYQQELDLRSVTNKDNGPIVRLDIGYITH